jgi:hypothetical protein
MSNIVISTIQRASTGKWEVNSVGENLRTNDGVNWQAAVMGGGWGDVSVTGNYPVRIAVTEDTTAPASSMTNLWAELITSGMSRDTGTYSHTADASSYTLTATWQNTGSTITVATAGAAFAFSNLDTSVDTHFAITALSPVAVLDSNDTLQIAWGFFY